MPNARVGVRVLVRRHRQPYHLLSDRVVITDYITERCQNGWCRVTVVYPEEDRSPYPAPYDATHSQAVQAPPPSPALLPLTAFPPLESVEPLEVRDRAGNTYRAQDFATPLRA